MEILAIFNQENVTKKELENFKTRKTARGVIFDQENNYVSISCADFEVTDSNSLFHLRWFIWCITPNKLSPAKSSQTL